MAFVNFRVNDFGNFILYLAFNINQQRQGLNMVLNFIRKSGLKHGDMENGVDTSESVRKSEGKGMGSGFCKDLKGS